MRVFGEPSKSIPDCGESSICEKECHVTCRSAELSNTRASYQVVQPVAPNAQRGASHVILFHKERGAVSEKIRVQALEFDYLTSNPDSAT